MQITFGKWQGWTTDDLAKSGKTGQSFLIWGAENLKSSKWRKDFQRALNENSELDVDLMARAIEQDDPETVILDSARKFAEEEIREAKAQAEYNEKDAQMQNFLRRKLSELGISDAGVRFIVSSTHQDFEELERFGRIQFSSEARKKGVLDLVARYLEASYKLSLELGI